MAPSEESVRILVVVPKEYAQDIDKLIGPGRRTRSAVARLLIEAALGRSLFLPDRSLERPNTAHTDQQPLDCAATN